jgi:hypothetical protein
MTRMAIIQVPPFKVESGGSVTISLPELPEGVHADGFGPGDSLVVQPRTTGERKVSLYLRFEPAVVNTGAWLPIDFTVGAERYREWILPQEGDQRINLTFMFSEPESDLRWCNQCRRLVRGQCRRHP